MDSISELIKALKYYPNSNQIPELLKRAESNSSVEITKQIHLLKGVWELKWSSSKSPLLNYSPLLDNLQILDPERKRGLNLLKPKGFMANVISTNIYSSLEVIDQKRLIVSFKKVGINGPIFFGKQFRFITEIKKTQKGWLDTTVLTQELRVCRGYKGTTFALLKRNEIAYSEFF